MRQKIVFLLLTLVLVSCTMIQSTALGQVWETPTPTATATLVPTATPMPPTPTPIFLQMEEVRVSRALLEQPELYLEPFENYDGRVVNVPSTDIPTVNGKVFVYRPPETFRVSTMDYSLRINGGCDFSLANYVNNSKRIAREGQIPLPVVGALVLSESSYVNVIPDGQGGCYIMNNGVAACLTQIYKPAGWKWGAGQQIHPEVNVYDLFDSYRCLSAGRDVLLGRIRRANEALSGPREDPASWHRAVAGYKNIDTSHSHFTGVYLAYLQAGGFIYNHPIDGRVFWIDMSQNAINEDISLD